MKKFIKKRAGDLSPGDIVVMANSFHIHVTQNNVTDNVATVIDARNNAREWAASYICHTLNPMHPEFGIK